MGKPIYNTKCHCIKMRRSAENIVSFYDRILKPSGVTTRQYSLLTAVRKHSDCSISSLSGFTELDRSTLTRSLKPLIKQNLITDLKKSGERNSKLNLTPKGKKVQEEAASLWQNAQNAYEERLGQQRLKELEDILLILQYL